MTVESQIEFSIASPVGWHRLTLLTLRDKVAPETRTPTAVSAPVPVPFLHLSVSLPCVRVLSVCPACACRCPVHLRPLLPRAFLHHQGSNFAVYNRSFLQAMPDSVIDIILCTQTAAMYVMECRLVVWDLWGAKE